MPAHNVTICTILRDLPYLFGVNISFYILAICSVVLLPYVYIVIMCSNTKPCCLQCRSRILIGSILRSMGLSLLRDGEV